MNILEYIKQGGLCKSKSGHEFVKGEIHEGTKYPIKGSLVVNNNNYYYAWTEDGIPHNLPYNHGLDLMPVVPVVSYKMVKKDLLSRYMTREEFERDSKIL